MIEIWTQDDLDLFEEVTGIKVPLVTTSVDHKISPNIHESGEYAEIFFSVFYYEFYGIHEGHWMFSNEIIESVILLAHSIPRKDLLEMLR